MKFQSNNLLESLSNLEITTLTKEVKETLQKNFAQPKKKVFTQADLWNIHRQRKNFSERRFY